jgi:acetyl-CoA carboxylase biotin carboxylase subunit
MSAHQKTPIRRILIANRGEIAVRIIDTCQRLGIETILAASEVDLRSRGASLADHTICIGPPNSAQSYLSIDNIIAAAKFADVDAIHPGYGFLSENRKLAEACEAANIIFIGPSPAQLDAVGDKLKARTHAEQAGLPGVPGGKVSNMGEAHQLADQIGYPILIKAVAGGGGRGMKQVHDAAQLAPLIELAMAEAQAAFGDSRIYLERFIAKGRHVEVQVLGDGQNAVHLGTRDCSIQRRYQKLIEEAPAPNLAPSLREGMQNAAVAFAKHLNYRGLGTVEMLVDCDRNAFHFLEMNARIQVEHPVTEAITNLDLVEQQIAVAEGHPLRYRQRDIVFHGHAIECRINAEDWHHDFRPSPGIITKFIQPAGRDIRVDTHMQPGAAVPPYYDSLLAKLIVHGEARATAVAKTASALNRFQIAGVTTNLGMHSLVLRDKEFAQGGVDTGYLPRLLQSQNVAVTSVSGAAKD